MAADSDVLKAKLALEQELVRPLGQALAAYIALWVRSESRVPFWETVSARTSIEQVLMRHYARCCYVVRGIRPPRDARLDDAALDAQHRESLAARAHRQSLRYMQSIDRELARASEQVGLTQKAVAAHYETKASDKQPWSVWMTGKLKETAQTAWRKVKARMRAIVNNETQEAVEGAIFRWVKQKHANARIYKRWETMKDDRVRHPPKSAFDHVAAQDQEVLVSQPFVVSGERLMFPGDSTLGASLGNLINCFPGDTRVSGFVRAATRHWYSGDLIEITTRLGHKLAGTPNHPILTSKGWVGLGSLNEGDKVGHCGSVGQAHDAPRRFVLPLHDAHHVDDVEPFIEQVFNALSGRFVTVREVRSAVDFHGDRPTHDVDVVRADSSLRLGRHARMLQHGHQRFFDRSRLDLGRFLPGGLSGLLDVARLLAAPGFVGFPGECLAGVGVGSGHAIVHRRAAPPALDPVLQQYAPNALAGGLEGDGERLLGLASRVSFDDVALVERRRFVGHVYNIETDQGWYYANGLLAHNCRCGAHYVAIGNDGRRVELQINTPHLPARRTWRAGDKPGNPTPIRATEAVTLNGTTDARVVLGDGRTIARMRQETPGTLVVSIGRDVVARAEVNTRTGVVRRVQIAAGREPLGIEELIRRSVTHSAEHLRRVSP